MKRFYACLLATLFFALAGSASAQVFFSNTRVGSLAQYHTVVGTGAQVAISSSSVSGSLIAWKICNDAVNSSTYMYVGKAADPTTDGVKLAPGSCFECPNCIGLSLKAVKVSGQAASNGYSVIQYKPQ